MTCGISFVDTILNKSFAKLGYFIGKHPGYFIIIPVLLTLLCMTGYQQIKYEIDPEYLFSPISGEGKTERAIIENYFKVNYTHRFNVGRITRPGRFGRVIITSKTEVDGNLITKEVFQELRILDDLIQNTTVHFDSDEYTYTSICARWEDDCFVNDILNLDYILDDILIGKINLTFPAMFNPITWDAHAFPVFFGGTKLSKYGTIVSVPAIQMVYFVTANTKRQDAIGAAWEDAFLDAVGKAEENNVFKYISIGRFASRTLDHELERNTRTVVPYFASTFILMAGFSVITCMMGDTVRSKPWLGFFGNVSALMATLAAFGLAMYLGIEFIGINLAAPFLMIGIGIDDTFVMLAAWRRTSIQLSVPERMSLTLSEAAVSITITSLTDMVSFWIGILSPFPSVQIFCTYSGFAVCFTFVWHITFFAGIMAVSGYCEAKNLHSIFGFKVQPVSVAIKEKRSWLYRKFITGGINHDDPDNPLDNKEHMLMGFFKKHMANFINNGWIKMLIIIIFGIYLMGAGYGVTKIKEGLERRKLSKSDSYSVKFFDLEDAYYREFPYRIQVIIADNNLEYSNLETQLKIENLLEQLENTSYVTSSVYTESWLRSFLSFVNRNADFLNVTLDTEEHFINALREHYLFPGNTYSLDVKFNANATKIIASRFLIQAVNITDTNHEKEMVKDLRKICHDSPLNVSVFHPYFVFFDQFELVRPTSIQNMLIGGIVMMLIAFIFIPNILCSLWVAFSIISIEVGVVGYMSLWDVNLDSISMINLIMCIGFSVDFTAHICYAYMSSKHVKPADRVRESLYSLGMPIVQGSISTILGCLGLLLADSYIFLVFFKMIFLVIFFGAMHGLFLLPVLLSLFGPGSCCPNRDADADIDNDDGFNIDNNKKKKYNDLSTFGKIYPQNYTIPHPHVKTLNTPFGNKVFHNNINRGGDGDAIAAGGIIVGGDGIDTPPFKRYGDEKDLGIGTSGEDSSESSSHNSQQRRQAIEDANLIRRYEEGWRRSSHNLMNEFQAIPMYGNRRNSGGGDAVLTHERTEGSGERILPIVKIKTNKNLWLNNDVIYPPIKSSYLHQQQYVVQQSSPVPVAPTKFKVFDKKEKMRRKSDELIHYKNKYAYTDDDLKYYLNKNYNTNDDDDEDSIVNNNSNNYNNFHTNNTNINNNYNNDDRRHVYEKRRYSDDYNRKRSIDEKRSRKYSPPEGIYRQNPHRSSSQHNLYYPRQSSVPTPPIKDRQISTSQTSLHKLKHMGDIRFP